MQISITPAGGKPLNLSGNLPAQGFQRLRIAAQSQMQEVPGLGAADTAYFPRGNKKVTFSYSAAWALADAETAAYFAATYEELFPVQGLVTYQTSAGTLYLQGVASVTDLETLGATCTVTYRLNAGGFYLDSACTKAAPPPPDPVG